jgi:histidinol phosphatase-like PHP family hydrolase
MFINSDLHLHSEFSYDATLTLEELGKKATELGLSKIGITDHLNFNDSKFIDDIKRSSENVKLMQEKYPCLLLGVELTPIEKPEFDYIAKYGTRDGYVAPASNEPYPIELGMTKEELKSLGIRYAIGAAHWRVDTALALRNEDDVTACIKEWHRQQMFLAVDERVTVLGHPWYNGRGLWYEDFSVIPRSMNSELMAALKENKKYAECNTGVLLSPKASEIFKRQYAEFLREMFEYGIQITFGTDAHRVYEDKRDKAEFYLANAGFKEGDITEISEYDLW